jgi:hypothetical protein
MRYRFKVPYKDDRTREVFYLSVTAETTREARDEAVDVLSDKHYTVIGGLRKIINMGKEERW